MASDSTYLLDQRTDHGVKADELATLLDEVFETPDTKAVIFKGTIEEGMLSVLGFKRSLFAGVLDSGESEVFLGGSRLKRFIESVETVTTGIPAPVAEEAPEPAAADPVIDPAAVVTDRCS